MDALTVAVSPCPNDTFIFGAWVLGYVPDAPDARFFWHDVEELNRAAGRGEYDVVKVSAVRGLGLAEYEILDAGAAFGRGAGPKLVAAPGAAGTPRRVAVPGLMTTACALLRAALGPDFEAVPVVYDRVADEVREGRADAGLLIHETALAPQRYGLEVRLDLGAWWDGQGGGPLPLGVICAKRSLGKERLAALERTIRASLDAAREDRARVWPLARSLARELDDAILCAHVDAYVGDLSRSMGEAGRTALARLAGMVQASD
ncbi:MAG: MqnA/MqnD/SBP family protein [Thermodesulfobacteriota bacterium]